MHSSRFAIPIVAALLAVGACTQTRSNTDSAGASAAGVSAAGIPASSAAAVTPDSSTASATPSSPVKRTGDLPARRPDSTPPRQVDNPCGGIHVNVMVRSSALAQSGATSEAALRSVATELIATVREQLVANTLQLSPAIRTFRVTARDQAAADVVVARLGQAARVESVEADQCIRRQ